MLDHTKSHIQRKYIYDNTFMARFNKYSFNNK